MLDLDQHEATLWEYFPKSALVRNQALGPSGTILLGGTLRSPIVYPNGRALA